MDTTKLFFVRGGENTLEQDGVDQHDDAIKKIAESVSESVNAKNLTFLLGAGCSSLSKEGDEVGIPTMGPLAKEFIPDPIPGDSDEFTNDADQQRLSQLANINVADPIYRENLERLMEVLHTLRFLLERGGDDKRDDLEWADRFIQKLQKFIISKCIIGEFSTGDDSVLNTYRRFYRKLVYRDRSLPRPWVFSTNYDLFSEAALDSLGIVFCNGFTGTLNRQFNPGSFRYALAEQLDISDRKWATVDSYVYLCKLHGSINWIADNQAGIHGVSEKQDPSVDTAGETMIYPTPMKHHATLASPYTDLFREFQSQIVREQTVLITAGYSFSDEHINAIIHQALTVPTFRLIVFGTPDQPGIGELIALNDPRIWVIGGPTPDGAKAHYFEQIVDSILPELPGVRIESSVNKVVELICKGLSDERVEEGENRDR